VDSVSSMLPIGVQLPSLAKCLGQPILVHPLKSTEADRPCKQINIGPLGPFTESPSLTFLAAALCPVGALCPWRSHQSTAPSIPFNCGNGPPVYDNLGDFGAALEDSRFTTRKGSGLRHLCVSHPTEMMPRNFTNTCTAGCCNLLLTGYYLVVRNFLISPWVVVFIVARLSLLLFRFPHRRKLCCDIFPCSSF
jgi:hypothetical protein